MKSHVAIESKWVLFIVGIFICHLVSGQIVDDFNDGNFADGAPITWTASQTSGGDDFVITSGEVQSNGPASSGDLFLSTDLNIDFANNDVVWTFKCRYTGGGPSGSNRLEIYLISDVEGVSGSPNGYYIGMGESGSTDGIDLFKTSSGAALINDDNDLVGAGIDIHVRVTRTGSGLWTLEADATGGDTFSLIGNVTDTEFGSGSFFGFYVQHTSTRADDFFFDDFSVTVTPVPDTTPPTIQSTTAISETQVDVLFSEDVDATTSENSANYSIDNGITVTNAERDASNNALVHLTTSSLINGQNYSITTNNVEDLNSNAILSNTMSNFQYLVVEDAVAGDIVISEFLVDTEGSNDDFVELYNRSDKYIDLENWVVEDGGSTGGPTDPFSSKILAPSTYLILYKDNSLVDYSTFGDFLEVTSSDFTFNNTNDTITLKDDSGSVIANIGYGTDIPEEGISLELINPHDPCLSILSYIPSISSSGSTPGVQNSVFDDTPDTVAPTITSFGFSSTLMLNFSEPIDAASIDANRFVANGGLTIDQVLFDGDFPESVEVSFNESIVLGESYDVTISDLTDCTGNAIEETTISFSFGRPPSFNELIITEILFDENPSVGLPEREFIEIFNASGDIISTEDVMLMDANGSTSLPTFNLLPGTYRVLTSTSGASEFTDVVGVTSFPSLSNSGEQLTLTYGSNLIFSIDYDPAWHEESRSDGGYSLEMIDYTNPCVESPANWTSSIDVDGGTPGLVNSVSNPQSVPDNMPPELLTVVAMSADTIIISLSEKLDPGSLDDVIYSFTPTLSVDSSFLLPNNTSSIYAILSTSLLPNQPYTVSVQGITDCNGNEIGDNQETFALPVEAIEGEVIINEVLFNPRTNGVDFVELYNNSENYITLKNWQLARIDDEGLDDQVIISDDELVLNPGDYLVLTEDMNVLFNNYPSGVFTKFFEVTPFPTYANDTGNVVLINTLGDIYEQFFYDEDYHYDLLEDVDGVSLERVSFDEPTNNPDNWRSASSTVGFATPAFANSQSIESRSASGKITPDPKVFVPGDAAQGRDFTLINYQFDQPGKFANVDIYDQSGRLVKNLANGVLLATSGFLRWDGQTDAGGIARMGYYLIIFEIYDNNGNSEIIKETVAVGRDF